MAFDDFHVKPVLTSLAFTLVYDWFAAHVTSIADVREVINLLTLSGANNGAIFKYTMEGAISQDQNALAKLMELVPRHKLSQAEKDALRTAIDNELLGIYGKTNPVELPDRIKELKILVLEKDYKLTLGSSNLYVLSPK